MKEEINELRCYDMNGIFQMLGGKNWILPKEINANRFFWDSHWLEIWSNHLYLSLGPNACFTIHGIVESLSGYGLWIHQGEHSTG
jgi:hypothetical protein